ncbi:MAG TPA: HAD-IA family hydrolase [Nitrospiraceae bacterium]|jgi:phosphoglycolate phosphatase|nr:HAD-IA family hydrolase [Nitrospiraceae bacterium]
MIKFNRPFDARTIQLLIFDLDGTLIDSRLDLVHSVNATLRHMKRPELPDDVIASYVGDGAPALIGRALGSEAGDEKLVRSGLDYFLSYYREHKLDHTHLYDGIVEALATLQNHNGWPRKMAVLTNKPVHPSRAIVEALGLGGFFSRIYGGNSFPTKKPDPEGAQAILREMGTVPQKAMIVGDSGVDILTGRNAGTWTCGVTYGFAPHTLHDAGPDVLIDRPAELAELFARAPYF